MQILTYKYPNAKFTQKNTNEIFKDELSKADGLQIASGYISSDSLIELKKTIELNKKPRLELLIGMHYFDGFTNNQWSAAIELNNYLTNYGLGGVFVSKSVRFHGKVYSFNYLNGYSSIIGSSNLSSILDTLENLYEFDIFFNELKICADINNTLTNIIKTFGCPINNITPKIIQPQNLVLENYGIERINDTELNTFINSLTNIRFEIPLKYEPKSNLNVFFGKGRKNQRDYVLPRPWYEVELIVSSTITSNPNYPKGSFEVITDDGWKFKCKTSGDYHKNFRSEQDLQILGRWIKGKLENAEKLKVGEVVTEEVIKNYGKDYLVLQKSNLTNIWYLNFKP